MKKDNSVNAFDNTIANGENEKNKIHFDFLEDNFDLASDTDERRNHLADYNRKYGFLSKVLSIVIYLLILVIIYQVITIISYYV